MSRTRGAGGRVLIVGAAGFVGGHVTREAVRQGRDLRLLAHRRPADDHGVAEVVCGDLADPASLHGLCEGVDVVLHCASYIGSAPEMNLLVNAQGTRNLLAEAQRAAVARFVYVSTASVYGHGTFRNALPSELERDPSSPTSHSRALAEDAVLGAGGFVLRPHLVYGEGDAWVVPTLAELLRALPGRVDDWSAKISVISAQDLARLVVATGLAPASALSARIHHAVHPEPVQAWELLHAAAEHIGHQWPSGDLSMARARELLAGDRRLTHALRMLATDHAFDASSLWRDLRLEPGPGLAKEGLGKITARP